MRRLPVVLICLAGCSEYGFGGKDGYNAGGSDTADDPSGGDGDDEDFDDDGIPNGDDPDDDDDGIPDDQDDDDDDDGIPDDEDDDDDNDGVPDDAEDDVCYEPDAAYDMHPAAGLVVTQEGIAFEITFDGSDAGYTNELWVWEPVELYVGTGHVTAPGTTVVIGTLTEGSELLFGIVVTDNGDVFYSGPATRNADGFDHAAITYGGDCQWVVGFEDQYGGGDQDFNDIELTISGPLEMRLVK